MRSTRRQVLAGGLAALAAIAAGVPARAQALTPRQQRRLRRRRRRWRRRERRRLRDAIRRGDARPLRELIHRFDEKIDGEILDVRYRERGPFSVYVFVVLAPEGVVTRYIMDARSGEIFTFAEALRHYGFAGDD